MDTRELSAVSLAAIPQGGTGKVRALFLYHRFYNDGADAATTDLPLRAGERRQMPVCVLSQADAAHLHQVESLEMTAEHRYRIFRECPAARATE